MINQTLPVVLTISAFKKEVSLIFNFVSVTKFAYSLFFFFVLNHFPVTIASLKEGRFSFDEAFFISIFARPQYLSFSCLSFRHVKNPLFLV